MDSQLSEDSPPRPLGVWLLTAYALIFAGFLPLLASILLLVAPGVAEQIRPLDLVVPIIISTGIIASAIATFIGSSQSIWVLLTFILLNYVLIAINNFLLLQSPEAAPSIDAGRAWGRVLRGAVMPAIYFWYFLSRRWHPFFSKHKRTPDVASVSPVPPVA